MEFCNYTLKSGFILVGILDDNGFPELLCATITSLYFLAVTSNGLLLLVITMDARLHVPMYLLLWQLSLMDLLLTSVITPKAVIDFLLEDNTISFGGCALQMFLALTLGTAEDLLLSFMAYDSPDFIIFLVYSTLQLSHIPHSPHNLQEDVPILSPPHQTSPLPDASSPLRIRRIFSEFRLDSLLLNMCWGPYISWCMLPGW
uniref:olfactory receptor 2AG1-like isoform X2 n=1 Tax=Arvicanthis niloticus TaxID=61156 RepID=UPI00402B8F1C